MSSHDIDFSNLNESAPVDALPSSGRVKRPGEQSYEQGIPRGQLDSSTDRQIPGGFGSYENDDDSDFSLSVQSAEELQDEEEIKVPDRVQQNSMLPDQQLSPQTQRDQRPSLVQEERGVRFTDRMPDLVPIEEQVVASPPRAQDPAPDRYSYVAPPVEVPPVEEEKEPIFPDPPIFSPNLVSEEESKSIQPMAMPETVFSAPRFELNSFICTPLDQSVALACKITRVSSTLGFSTVYRMTLAGESNRFICQARKKFSRRAHYVIGTSEEKNTKEYQGKLRKTSGSNYVLYDNGLAPKYAQVDEELRAELMSIDCYNERSKEVYLRNFDVIIPGIQVNPFKPRTTSTNIKNSFAKGERKDVITFESKKPTWDPATKSFKMNFGGKAKKASVKNIQLVSKRQKDTLYLQMTKRNKHDFLLDFYGPFSPLQAFAMAIANIDHGRAY